ncbi:hypothetical protein CK503_00945 [Aliifodinibius salipaludis]|uniref:Response regulatory domain-containing protein n=1 Tax=Fodinibius salipaludis TaxID=2032627 RepID=A0A2A2GDP7_9BACT|nr:response regulator [Aliifodinibius salipaludis]PAU95661.1 hypothetical protein CK503_00945 [Aliifodinibius salipaludis]
MDNLKIFIVDDSPIQLVLLEKVLLKEGFSVEAFSKGADLIKALSVDTPYLIISDIHMPELNGFELIEKVRGFSKGENIPCFLVSSKADDAIRKQARTIGVDRFIKKPFEYQSLLGIIDDLLRDKDTVLESS